MITLGSPRTVELSDGWTVVTQDGSVAAHVEHTVALMPDGVWVLTADDGGRARLGDLASVQRPGLIPGWTNHQRGERHLPRVDGTRAITGWSAGLA